MLTFVHLQPLAVPVGSFYKEVDYGLLPIR